jgi:hypothetical protein
VYFHIIPVDFFGLQSMSKFHKLLLMRNVDLFQSRDLGRHGSLPLYIVSTG